MDPLYIKDAYEYIKKDAEDDEKNMLFVKYFEQTNLNKYDIKNWIYYRIFEYRTNNECESNNHILNSKFNTKPSLYGNLFLLLKMKRKN